MARHALLVGINQYSSAKLNLSGCVNDIESLARLLVDVYGFGAGDIELVRDAAATRDTILSRLDALLSGSKSGDTVVFGFSGHGTQIASTDPNETDMKDECIVPYEAAYNSLIKDTELHQIFNGYVDSSINFTAIYDCCHSGTMFRSMEVDEDGNFIDDIVNRYVDIGDLADLTVKAVSMGPYNVLGACSDDQTAADVRAAGPEKMPRGAFSYALHNFLRQTPGAPAAVAEQQIAAGIGAVSKHTQVPSYQLIDLNSPLIRH